MPHRKRSRPNSLIRASLILLILCQCASLYLLAVIGQPPVVRIDSLWVREHLTQIRFAAGGMIVAVVLSIMLLCVRQKWLVAATWIGVLILIVAKFWPQVQVIAAVAFKRFQ